MVQISWFFWLFKLLFSSHCIFVHANCKPSWFFKFIIHGFNLWNKFHVIYNEDTHKRQYALCRMWSHN